MFSGRIQSVVFSLLALFAASCSGSGGGSSNSNSIVTIEQDLTLDPTGATTVITFMVDPGTLDVTNFDADNGQVAQTVNQAGASFTVAWDAPVGTATQVRPLAVGNVASTFLPVTTSDASQSSFVITVANQVAGLGADTITAQFSGPNLIESEAEDIANWTLKDGTTTLPLAGSTFDFDSSTQTLSVTTGAMANLHASFSLAAQSTLHTVADLALATTAVAGVATGDAVPPTLTTVAQNLAQDPFGRVIDFTFSEAMDPIFCDVLSNFGGQVPDVATTFSQPTSTLLRVTFNNPIVPGVNTLDLENLLDAHGNAFPDQNVAVTAGTTVANNFATGPDVTTVEGLGGDLLEMTFVQAIDPDDASLPANWNLEIPTGNPIDLSNCVFTYDLLNKSLSVELDVDVQNGDTFTFEAQSGSEPHDVDGQLFTTSVAGLISGESSLPTLVSVTQNRVFDPTGKTLDISFSEAMDETTAETELNWNVPGHVVQTATLLPSKTVVRVDFDLFVLPGTDTLDVSALEDLAGNAMAAVLAHAVVSTDVTAPAASQITAAAVEGSANDIVRVTFNDDLIVSEISDLANWTLESPVGVSMPLVGAGVAWNSAGRQATITLPDGSDLVGGNSARAAFANVHDIGGNAISAATITTTVSGEVNVPVVDSVWVKTALTNHVVVRFSEPCTQMDDITGLTHYAVHNSLGTLKGTPTSATESVDHLGVELVFGFAVVAGSDTLDLSGITDVAGNAMFPVLQHAVAPQDSSAVGFDDPASDLTAVTGEANDVVTIVFTTKPSRWNLLLPANYTISLLGTPLDLSGAHFSYDGAFTVTILLDGLAQTNLQTGAVYDVDMPALDSVQGVTGSPMNAALTAGGESTAPTMPAGLTRIDAANPLDSVLIQFSEAVDEASAETLINYDLNGGANPDTVTRVGLNTVRATWNGGVIQGDTVNATVADLAGNIGVMTRAVTAEDPQGPLVVSVDGVSVQNSGLDTIAVEFDKPIDLASGLSPSNYGVTNGLPVVLSNASLSFNSTNDTVTIHLPAGVELDPTQGITVTVQNVEDLAGLVMSPPANIGGAVTGDSTPPAFGASFANYRADVAGLAIDVRFSEDIPTSFATLTTNWSVSGGQTVDLVTMLTPSHYRLTLSAAMTLGETLDLTAVPDMAGNVSGALSISPTL
ncbi:MAG TPA: hypothetical protein VK843_14620 [Planctomycetota bacterium]|nr:hypothetical protein [Planctomycetota bacterium]